MKKTNMKNRIAFSLMFTGMAAGALCYLYFDFKEKSSDRYAVELMTKGECECLSFGDGSWLKTLIFDAGSFPPYHGHLRGAVYLMDSHARVMKITGGYVKPKRFTYEMITNSISGCQNVEEALSNRVWKDVFPWFERGSHEKFIP